MKKALKKINIYKKINRGIFTVLSFIFLFDILAITENIVNIFSVVGLLSTIAVCLSADLILRKKQLNLLDKESKTLKNIEIEQYQNTNHEIQNNVQQNIYENSQTVLETKNNTDLQK